MPWDAGRAGRGRASDGVRAAQWRGSVEASTGFAPPARDRALAALAEAARPAYERLRPFAL
ncbi:hypothetical protein [Amaricoccus sp.]|uniref:hypothetical protein n=1 Tax=Amaricoccus sp. TaxID=1872485 RepID=UPI001B524474|nr:hypothetical protein [Amaricoccus sp.]MBP7001433.1 hypothetical protein [Amaricoccus sp.]